MSLAGFLIQSKRIIVSKVFILLFSSLLAICLSVSYALSEPQQQPFLSITTLGSNMTTQNYFPRGDSTILVQQNVQWYVNVYNHMGNAQLVSIRMTLLGPDQIMFDNSTRETFPSQGPVIFEARQLLAANSNWLVPLDWAITQVMEEGEYLVIKATKVNGNEITNFDVRSLDGKNFRVVLELWRYDPDLKDIVSTWSSTAGEVRSSWNQIWFNVVNRIEDHKISEEVQPAQQPSSNNATQVPSDSDPDSSAGTEASPLEFSQNANNTDNTPGSITVGGGGGGGGSGGGGGGSSAGSQDRTPPTVTGIFSRQPDTINKEYNQPVKVTWVGVDEPKGSGIGSCDAPTTYSGPDGIAILLIGHCVDKAGNEGTGNVTLNYNSASTRNRSYSLSLNSSELNVGSDISAIATTNNTSIKHINFVWKDPTNTVAANSTHLVIQDAGKNSSATDLFTAPNQTGLWRAEAHFLDTAGNEVIAFTKSFTVVVSSGGETGNTPPISEDDNGITTPVDTPIVINVLTNDSDPDGDSFDISSFSHAANGLVTDNDNGTLTYTPNENFTGEDSFTYRISDGSLQSDNATVIVLVTRFNVSPLVNAGPDQNITEEILVSLDGSAVDDNEELVFFWSQIISSQQEPAVTLSDADTLTPLFISPSINHTTFPPLPITLTFQLLANDNTGGVGSDTVLVIVNDVNKLPIAEAGSDQIVNETSDVSLSALDSSDADGDALTYSWRQTDGPSVELNDVNSATTSFIAPEVSGSTILTFELTVSDGFGGDSSDSVNIVVDTGGP